MRPWWREYTALNRRWGDQWDVFVPDPVEGLIGSTAALRPEDVEHAARTLVCGRLSLPVPAPEVRITVVVPR